MRSSAVLRSCLCPKRIVVVGMCDPRSTRAKQCSGGSTQRNVTGAVCPPSPMLATGDAASDALRILLVRNQIAPAQKIVDGERAGTFHLGVEIVWSRASSVGGSCNNALG